MVEFNLYPWRKQRYLFNRNQFIISIIVSVLINLTIICYIIHYQQIKLNHQQQTNNILLLQLELLKKQHKKLLGNKNQQMIEQKKHQLIRVLQLKQLKLLKLLSDLSLIISYETRLIKLDKTSNQIKLFAITKDSFYLLKLVRKLKHLSWVNSVNLSKVENKHSLKYFSLQLYEK